MNSVGEDSFLTERNSADIVVARLKHRGDMTLSRALVSAVSHLHQALRETRPTQAELRHLIEFLTEMGQACDEKRQEWVLLFDVLGASALIEDINTVRPKGATQNTVRGPFYRADAPHYPDGANISLDGVGEPLSVSGRVVDLDGIAISGARIETWQANRDGYYENQQPDLQPEFNLRGIFESDHDGRFQYRTVKPAGYSVPSDGPAGQMLGRVGYPLRRPAHLHFQISAPGFETITTNIFDSEDPHLGEDALFGVKSELIATFTPVKIKGSPEWRLEFTFVMARARKNGRPV
jgi:hydroxyquinol 1,2-dioxygenase